ncbi:MFS transporter, partial [Paraburkholderia sp. SIMBA_053]
GANIGAVFAPAIIPPLALAFGWRAAFVIIGALGLLWLVVWFAFYRSAEPRSHDDDLDEARDEVEALDAANVNARAPGWGVLIRKRQ